MNNIPHRHHCVSAPHPGYNQQSWRGCLPQVSFPAQVCFPADTNIMCVFVFICVVVGFCTVRGLLWVGVCIYMCAACVVCGGEGNYIFAFMH